MPAIPLVDIRFELEAARPEIEAAIARVLDTGVFIGGPEVEAFEDELAVFAGVRTAIGTSSGTDALLVSLMAMGIAPGDEVITTPLSFFAAAGAIARLGARPVFADVDENLCLDPQRAAAAVGPRTRAVIPVNLFGRPAQVLDVPVPVLEDSAQSLGAGPIRGRAATISFFPTKNLGALGDAGAVLTDHADLADRIRLLRTHGARPRHHHVAVGGNFRLDALQAAILRARLPHLAASIAARRERAARYNQWLLEASLPADVILPADHPDHVWHHYVIRVPERDALRAHLAAAEIGTEIYYPVPLHRAPCFAELGYAEGSFPVAEAAARQTFALPVSPALTQEQQIRVVGTIASFYQSRRRR
jgi:dTDP-4-amino-4,6-dideoxygalactose transaminase